MWSKLTVTPKILQLVSDLNRLLGRFEGTQATKPQPKLRKQNRIRTIRGSLAIEGNTLSLAQITDILDGKTVLGPANEILEVKNAIRAYENSSSWSSTNEKHFLTAHRTLMSGLVDDAGEYRAKAVGVLKGSTVAHIAPPAARVPELIKELFARIKKDEFSPIIKSCVLHYEIEFIHPFSDGNGRMGRLWQHVALLQESPLFDFIPLESVIHKHQKKYYHVLESCDKSGEVTLFVEFMLERLLEAAQELFEVIKPEPFSAQDRLNSAKEHFGKKEFSRKDYLQLFKFISTATASRDLALATEEKQILRNGDKAKAKYRFS